MFNIYNYYEFQSPFINYHQTVNNEFNALVNETIKLQKKQNRDWFPKMSPIEVAFQNLNNLERNKHRTTEINLKIIESRLALIEQVREIANDLIYSSSSPASSSSSNKSKIDVPADFLGRISFIEVCYHKFSKIPRICFITSDSMIEKKEQKYKMKEFDFNDIKDLLHIKIKYLIKRINRIQSALAENKSNELTELMTSFTISSNADGSISSGTVEEAAADEVSPEEIVKKAELISVIKYHEEIAYLYKIIINFVQDENNSEYLFSAFSDLNLFEQRQLEFSEQGQLESFKQMLLEQFTKKMLKPSELCGNFNAYQIVKRGELKQSQEATPSKILDDNWLSELEKTKCDIHAWEIEYQILEGLIQHNLGNPAIETRMIELLKYKMRSLQNEHTKIKSIDELQKLQTSVKIIEVAVKLEKFYINASESRVRNKEGALERIDEPFTVHHQISLIKEKPITIRSISGIFSYVVSSCFETTVQQHYQKLGQLEIELQRLPSTSSGASSSSGGVTEQHQKLKDQINKTKLLYHSSLLGSIIDLTGPYVQKRQELKKSQPILEDITAAHLDCIDQLLSILNEIYKTHMDLYRHCHPSPKKVLALLREELSSLTKDILSLGIYNHPTYITPEEFDSRKKFADAGYSISLGMHELCQFSGPSITHIIKQRIGEFLEWADENPKDAVRMASDILLTIGILCDEKLSKMLSNQLNAKIFISSLLGTMGRTSQEQPVRPHHFKFRALADYVRYGPSVVSLGKVVKEAVNEFLEQKHILWGICKAFAKGIATFAEQRTKIYVLQRVVSSLDDTMTRASSLSLALMRGDSMQQIVSSQATIELTKLVGNIRRVYLAPGAVIREFRDRIIEPFRLVCHSTGGIAEYASRIGAITGIWLLSYNVVSSKLESPSEDTGSIDTVAMLVTAVALTVLMTHLVNSLLNQVWSETPRRLKQEDVEDMIETKREHLEQIEKHAALYITDLRRLGVIPELSTSSTIEIEEDLLKYKDHLVEECKINLNKLEQQKLLDSTIIGNVNQRVLSSQQYVEIFTDYISEQKIRALINNSDILYTILHSERSYLKDQFVQFFINSLIENWLREKIQSSVRREFFSLYKSYGTNTNLEQSVAEGLEKQRLSRDKALKKITSRIISVVPSQHLQPHDEYCIKEKLRMITKRVETE